MNNIDDVFKPENKTIKQIFGDVDAFYEMPIYQRPYAWDKERVEQLWFDILEAYQNNANDRSVDKSYFLGSIVVIKKDDYYEVVDGQQRLTTLTILFCTLRDMKLDLKQNKIISNSVTDLLEDKKRVKLTTHLNNQAKFEQSVISGINFVVSKKELSENKFLQTSFYFKNLIERSRDQGDESFIKDFDAFIDYLLNQTTIIRVVCFDEGFAIKLFTVLNDRGLDLTAADIIKANLLQQLTDERKRDQFIEVWKQIEQTCKSFDESMQGVLNLYLYYLKSENPRKSLQDELKEQFKNIDPQKIIVDLQKFAENIAGILASSGDKDISMLKYLPQSIYWKSILATAKQVNYAEYAELKSVITKYFYQSWIAGGTANRIKQTSFNLLKKIKNKKSVNDIKKVLLTNLEVYPSYLNSLSEQNAYWHKWHKPLLLSIEYFQSDAKHFIELSSDLHTEHVLPQEWNHKGSTWSDYFSTETAIPLLNTLGNLTLLSGLKNIRASNRSYKDKLEIYRGKGLDGRTSFEITQKIMSDYPVWTSKSIQSRQEWIVSETKRILDIK